MASGVLIEENLVQAAHSAVTALHLEALRSWMKALSLPDFVVFLFFVVMSDVYSSLRTFYLSVIIALRKKFKHPNALPMYNSVRTHAHILQLRQQLQLQVSLSLSPVQ